VWRWTIVFNGDLEGAGCRGDHDGLLVILIDAIHSIQPWSQWRSRRSEFTRFTDTSSYYVSESSVYRLLKAHDLITSPAFIVITAADEFKDKTTSPNQLWQTDFTDLKVIGWGWYYLHHPR
jgi:hypothetical protein